MDNQGHESIHNAQREDRKVKQRCGDRSKHVAIRSRNVVTLVANNLIRLLLGKRHPF